MLYPFLVWGGVYYIVYKLIQFMYSNRFSVSVMDLLWQLLLGSSPTLNPPLWYQADMIILTIIYSFIFAYL